MSDGRFESKEPTTLIIAAPHNAADARTFEMKKCNIIAVSNKDLDEAKAALITNLPTQIQKGKVNVVILKYEGLSSDKAQASLNLLKLLECCKTSLGKDLLQTMNVYGAWDFNLGYTGEDIAIFENMIPALSALDFKIVKSPTDSADDKLPLKMVLLGSGTDGRAAQTEKEKENYRPDGNKPIISLALLFYSLVQRKMPAPLRTLSSEASMDSRTPMNAVPLIRSYSAPTQEHASTSHSSLEPSPKRVATPRTTSPKPSLFGNTNQNKGETGSQNAAKVHGLPKPPRIGGNPSDTD